MKSAYFIPTNRKIEKSANSYIKEIIYAKNEYCLKIPFVVVETNDDDFVKENHSVLENLKRKYPEVEIIHMTTDIQKRYFDKLFEDINNGQEIKKLFLDRTSNYGTTMNKISLLTCSLGAESFHRRDSDTCLISDELTDARNVYPIEYELKYLGKRIKELNDDGIFLPNQVDTDKSITVVGGNYFGEWNLDVKDFARKSFDIIYKLYELLGFEKNSIKEICDEAFRFDFKYEDSDKLSLVTSVNDGLNPDCGNVAVYKLHEYLPNLPGKNTLAADYFMFDTATALGLPSLHHTRPVFHEYHSERFEFERKKRYWYGVAKFCDYFNNYGTIYNDSIKDEFYSEQVLISESALQMIKGKIMDFKYINKDERVDRLKQIALQVLVPFDDAYRSLGENLLDNCERYIKEADEDYNNHRKLLDGWGCMIEKARKIDLRQFI